MENQKCNRLNTQKKGPDRALAARLWPFMPWFHLPFPGMWKIREFRGGRKKTARAGPRARTGRIYLPLPRPPPSSAAVGRVHHCFDSLSCWTIISHQSQI